MILGALTVLSCGTRNIDAEIKEKIEQFYDQTEAKGYEPIGYLPYDTIEDIRSFEDSTVIVRMKLRITHLFKMNEVDRAWTFDATVFENDVIVIPSDETLKKLGI